MPGSITSRTTRSKLSSEALRRSSASSPSPTATVPIPSRDRACSTTSLTAGSSSTISTLGISTHLRQFDLDPRTYAFFGLQRDLPIHPLHELLADGQPEAEAASLVRLPPPPVEAFEDQG